MNDREIGSAQPIQGRWYVARLQPGRAKLAVLHLERQGFRNFLPLSVKKVRLGRRYVQKTAPFFPGYMFVSFDINGAHWRSINGTIGVRSLIMQAERPVPVPIGFVEAVMSAADPDGVVIVGEGLTIGQPVKMIAGPFSDLVGRLDGLESGNRCRVLINMMSGQVPVLMDREDLIAA